MKKVKSKINQEKTKFENRLIAGFLLILIINFVCLIISCSINNQAVSAPNVPDPSTFKTGDLIWPKKPYQRIYYDTSDVRIYNDNKKRWEEERDAYIQEVQNDPNTSEQDREEADWLKKTSFGEFMKLYLGDDSEEWRDGEWRDFAFNYRKDEKESGYYGYNSWFPIYVGHVGMIFLEDNVPWVVEATPPNVRKITYAEWLKQYEDANIWHGHILNVDTQGLSKIVEEALEQVGKPYKLFNRNLNDEKKFYCSKPIWFSYYRALGDSIDDDTNPKRKLWYTPKRLMRSPHIEMIFKPGNY